MVVVVVVMGVHAGGREARVHARRMVLVHHRGGRHRVGRARLVGGGRSGNIGVPGGGNVGVCVGARPTRLGGRGRHCRARLVGGHVGVSGGELGRAVRCVGARAARVPRGRRVGRRRAHIGGRVSGRQGVVVRV